MGSWDSNAARNQQPERKPRCRSCGGETVHVLVGYGDEKLVYEWECMLCGKSFRVGSEDKHRGKKKFKKKPRKRYNANRSN